MIEGEKESQFADGEQLTEKLENEKEGRNHILGLFHVPSVELKYLAFGFGKHVNLSGIHSSFRKDENLINISIYLTAKLDGYSTLSSIIKASQQVKQEGLFVWSKI